MVFYTKNVLKIFSKFKTAALELQADDTQFY